jgi:hypothetical protein
MGSIASTLTWALFKHATVCMKFKYTHYYLRCTFPEITRAHVASKQKNNVLETGNTRVYVFVCGVGSSE